MKNILIKKINESKWWHVSPIDRNAYNKRGKFLASTYLQAEFYGRPNDESEKVKIINPIFGFSEIEILSKLFSKTKAKKYLDAIYRADNNFYKKRTDLDAKMYACAKKSGYNSIVLMAKQGEKALARGRKPNSIELNLII